VIFPQVFGLHTVHSGFGGRSKFGCNLTNASKFRKSKIYKGKLAPNFFPGPPTINRGT
jgi:hypothetical protein